MSFWKGYTIKEPILIQGGARMGFGDAYWLLGGALWTVRQGVRDYKRELERESLMKERYLRAKEKIEQLSDLDLECQYNQRLCDELEAPRLWEQVESYKRDNPVACYLSDARSDAKGDRMPSSDDGTHGEARWGKAFCWKDVGKRRVVLVHGSPHAEDKLRSAYWGAAHETRAVPENVASSWAKYVDDNRNRMVEMLMQTHGKHSLVAAYMEVLGRRGP